MDNERSVMRRRPVRRHPPVDQGRLARPRSGPGRNGDRQRSPGRGCAGRARLEYNTGMPLYEYACQECEREFETRIHTGEMPECPSCHGSNLQRRLSAFAAHTSGAASTAPPTASACGTCGDPRGPGACSINGLSFAPASATANETPGPEFGCTRVVPNRVAGCVNHASCCCFPAVLSIKSRGLGARSHLRRILIHKRIISYLGLGGFERHQSATRVCRQRS